MVSQVHTYVCVAFWCHAVTCPRGGLLSFTGLHHTSFTFLPRNAGRGICSLVYFWTWRGKVGVGGSSQARQLWKVLQAFQCSPWPRICYMCSKMIANVCVGCACVSKMGLWMKMANASQLIRLTVFPCAQESRQLLPRDLENEYSGREASNSLKLITVSRGNCLT